MPKTTEYRERLKQLDDWLPFLRAESGLPGPRGNLELAYAVADVGNRAQFEQLFSFPAHENTPEVFLVYCGIVGLGKLAAGDPKLFDKLREYASDPRWRIREAVATGLQLTGDQNMELLLDEMQNWAWGNWFEKRAAAAALAEPRLLRQAQHAKQVLQLLDQITASMEQAEHTADESFKILRQGMAYCWSVAVVACPDVGKPMMESWLAITDKHILWMMKQNLNKNRMVKMDAKWVAACIAKSG